MHLISLFKFIEFIFFNMVTKERQTAYKMIKLINSLIVSTVTFIKYTIIFLYLIIHNFTLPQCQLKCNCPMNK